MKRIYDHIDLRVPDLQKVKSFYQKLLPALGFTKDVSFGPWLQFEAQGEHGAPVFFGVIEDPSFVPNGNRIAFWRESPEEVDETSRILRDAGARQIEGPDESEGRGYYAVFFEDPCGNCLEICHRQPTAR
jgi:catechol 2,3-dioxygenase-like lactoylglutathione lyase family enzyme